MSESMRVGVEVLFNVSYLIIVWGLVIAMQRNASTVAPEDRAVARRVKWAFALLALGDTGHVGFRVIAYGTGGLDANPALVGLGALSTAITVTFFYMLMVDIWRLRFKKSMRWLGWTLLLVGLGRLVVMAFPQNQWEQVIAPYNWSLLRNALLTIQGLGVLYLILRDAMQAHDRSFIWIGIMVALSFAFYVPVILWVAQVPLLGMLMIPKTCAYLGIAILVYRQLYRRRSVQPQTSAAAT